MINEKSAFDEDSVTTKQTVSTACTDLSFEGFLSKYLLETTSKQERVAFDEHIKECLFCEEAQVEWLISILLSSEDEDDEDYRFKVYEGVTEQIPVNNFLRDMY